MHRLAENHCPRLWLPKCGSWMGSISTSWEIVRNAILPAPLQMHRIRTPGGGLQWLILRNRLKDSEAPSSLSITSLKQFLEYYAFSSLLSSSSCPASHPPSLSLIPKALLGKLHFHEGIYQSVEKGMATRSSILAWRIPWREGPGGL